MLKFPPRRRISVIPRRPCERVWRTLNAPSENSADCRVRAALRAVVSRTLPARASIVVPTGSLSWSRSRVNRRARGSRNAARPRVVRASRARANAGRRLEEINRRLEALSAETGLAFGTPELLKLAEENHIFDSAILYSRPLYRKPDSVGLRNSCTDLSRYLAGGAFSCETIGYNAVYLYEQPNFGPNKYVPAVRLIGCDRIAQTPCGILSALFV